MSLRVLLADESASIRKVFQMGLQDYGAEVKSVHNGLDVIEVAQNYEPDIIFVDILLQKKNGYEVAEEVGQNPNLKMTPVVLMWSSFMELDQGKYKSCGAKAELEKPFDIDKMRNLIKGLVETTRSQQLSDFLSFPKSITSEFVEEENVKADTGVSPAPPQPSAKSQTASPSTPQTPIEDNSEPFSFEVDDQEDAPNLTLEDDAPSASELEATSEFNIQADEPEEFNMYEVPPTPPQETEEQSLPGNDDENWEAKPLNTNMKSDSTQDQTQEDDFDNFQSMDLGNEKKLNLDDFLYKPETQSKKTEPKPEPEHDSISSTTRTGEIHNVHVPNYDNQTQPVGSMKMSNDEMEAIIRQEVRMALQKVIKDQLPSAIEKVVREELEQIMQQEMALKSAGQAT